MDLETMLKELAAAELAKVAEAKKAEDAKTAENTVSKADLTAMFASFKTDLTTEIKTAVEAEVAKSLPTREEGAGRKGPAAEGKGAGEVAKAGSPEQRDSDPVAYIVAKSKDASKLTDDDKEMIAALTFKALAGDLKVIKGEK